MITTNGRVNIHLQQRASAQKPEIVATHICQFQTAALMAPWCCEGGQGGLVWDHPFLPNSFSLRVLTEVRRLPLTQKAVSPLMGLGLSCLCSSFSCVEQCLARTRH